MKKFILVLITFFITIQLYGQSNTFIKASIIDAETQQSIPYVNVGFFDKAIGTTTNEQGQFSLAFDNSIVKQVPLQISAIGYESKEITFEEIEKLINFSVKITLIPEQYNLNEVTITSQKRSLERLGSKAYSAKGIGYWHEIEGLGGELATKIDIKHDNTLLHDLTFNIVENLSDSLLIRVNVYDYHRGFPGKNLLSQNIFHTVSNKKGIETIPLKKYKIKADNDIIVSLELVEVYGDVIYFAVSSSSYNGTSYTKKISQDRWLRQKETKLAFSLIASYTQQNPQQITTIRELPKKAEIFWDTSFSMRNRDFDEESKLLRKYLRKCNNIDIKVSKFNTSIYETKEFKIRNGNSNEVLNYLEESTYFGASSFSAVLKQNNFNASLGLLFSDGISQLSNIESKGFLEIFTVNSKKIAAHEILQSVANYNNGTYLDLTKYDVKTALEFLLENTENIEDYQNSTNDTRANVYGIVYNEEGPVQGAYIVLNDSFEIVETDKKGAYSINAEAGDKLTIDAIGMKTKDTVVSALKKLNISLALNAEKLAEVELKAKTNAKDRAEELVDTPFGKRMRGSVGYSLANRITSEEILGTDIDLMKILMKMPGVSVINLKNVPPQEPIYGFTRTMNGGINGGLPALIIDGLAYDQQRGQLAPRISAEKIESVTLLKSIAATTRYGSLGAFGLIVVKLKNSFNIEDTASDNFANKTPDITVKGNVYKEQLPMLEQVNQNIAKPTYITTLKDAGSFTDAKSKYALLLNTQDSKTISFYVNTGDYFKKWDKKYASTIYSTILELAPKNLKALKTAAYKLEEIGNHEKALEVYQYIVDSFPSKVQSYLDVARAYTNTKNYKEAGSLYTQMYFNTIPNVDFTNTAPTVINELRYLVANHKSQIDYKELPPEMLELTFKKDYRIVFEWNDPLAEFKIQFVNPENKYFTFSHTEFEDTELITSEIENGLHSKEFIIDDEVSGDWLINTHSFEREDIKNPVYLKMTTYEDFGLASQQTKIQVVNLGEISEKITLKKLITHLKK
ncbi:hypothetical protein ULMS_02740 [Patiriisocius marinistellae]|uniref:Uncharacterized protein n=1 Tax=Patiriisocius marinistellae TaxID=2494560 RepID=A0A5J4FXA9_9FLAO|nr:carboxypeptidase-like regulatory domain-containing protein [Patiriisocius marinistellae]GEQ84766.1 hypothetical protein ULMS_02740 [Patiriisocius marinistellae]